MSKPWDGLRVQVKLPIGTGAWATKSGCTVTYHGAELGKAYATLSVGGPPGKSHFAPECLRELAEFCTELADQLEGK